MSRFLEEDIDFGAALDIVEKEGVVSLRCLKRDARLELLEEAIGMEFPAGSLAVSSIRHRESFFEGCSKFVLLKEEIGSALSLGRRISFQEMELNRYSSSLGTNIHADDWNNYINWICIFVIEGNGRFYVCENSQGEGKRYLDTAPGRLIIIKPFIFHALEDIQPPRYSVVFRQLP